MTYQQNQDSDMAKAINNCFNCHRSALEALNYAMSSKSNKFTPDHIELLQLCVDVTELSSKMMIQNSRFHGQSCELCFEVCESCAEECEKFADDPIMTRTAKTCRHCAETCKHMAGMTVKITAEQQRESEYFQNFN